MPQHYDRQPRRSAAEWAKHVARWQRSGQDAATFAHRHRLSARSLIWWRWRLGAAIGEPAPEPALTFVPLVATSSSPDPTPTSTTEAPNEARWTLETATGLRLAMTGATPLVVEGLAAALHHLRAR